MAQQLGAQATPADGSGLSPPTHISRITITPAPGDLMPGDLLASADTSMHMGNIYTIKYTHAHIKLVSKHIFRISRCTMPVNLFPTLDVSYLG